MRRPAASRSRSSSSGQSSHDNSPTTDCDPASAKTSKSDADDISRSWVHLDKSGKVLKKASSGKAKKQDGLAKLDSKANGKPSVTRNGTSVNLILIMKAHTGNLLLIDEYAIIHATAVRDFMDLFWEIHLTLTHAWKDIKDSDAAKGWDFNIEKWAMELEEDTKVAGTPTTPLRMTERNLEGDEGAEAYKEWYDRNVLEGKQTAYRVSFDVVLGKKES